MLLIWRTLITWRVHGRYYGLVLKGNINDEEIDCRLDRSNLDPERNAG